MKVQSTILKLLITLGGVIILHLLILLKILPYEIAWGGRLTSDSEMYVFETISIVIVLLFSFILLIKGQFIKAFLPLKVVNIILWIFLVLFTLNTIANIFAKTFFEKSFGLITLFITYYIGVILHKTKGQKLK